MGDSYSMALDRKLYKDLRFFLQNKEYEKALYCCKTIVNENNLGNGSSIYFFLAKIYFNMKEYKLAEESILKAESLGKNTGKYFFLKAKILEKNSLSAEYDYYKAVLKNKNNEKYIKSYVSYMSKVRKRKIMFEKLCLVKNSFYIELEKVKYLLSIGDLNPALRVLESIKDVEINEQDKLNELYGDYYNKKGDQLKSVYYYKLVRDRSLEVSLKIIDNSVNFKKEVKESFYKFYNFFFEEKEGDSLTIVISPIKNKFILKNYSFKTSVLYLSENMYTYYTFGFDVLIKEIVEVIQRNNFNLINIIGSSKGAFAAINIGKELINIIGQERVNIVAFSPQTLLYPINENIKKLHSYNALILKSKKYRVLKFYFERYGNLDELLKFKYVNIKIVYGDLNNKDELEAMRLNRVSGIDFMPIPNYPFHMSLMLYTKKNHELCQAFTKKIYTRNKDDEFFRPKNNELLIRKFLKIADNYNYDLNSLIK